jgi:MoCo/4Fe-4S cofactor protein with predicted Tat translocation signal
MKTVFRHPPEDLTGKRYWRSLEELADTPQFRTWLEREFPAGAAEMELDGVSRRNFLRLMGASMALAGIGLSGCRRPEAYVVPYTKSVEWLIPGKAVLYTTSMPGPLGGLPLIATTYEGRPTKVEGNPLVPSSNGGTDVFAQASVLEQGHSFSVERKPRPRISQNISGKSARNWNLEKDRESAFFWMNNSPRPATECCVR